MSLSVYTMAGYIPDFEGDTPTNLKISWFEMTRQYQRPERSQGALFASNQDSRIFKTPFAQEYFSNILPDELPNDSKVGHIMVVTDLDVRMWHDNLSGPNLDTFDDFKASLYAEIPDDQKGDQEEYIDVIVKCQKASRYLERKFTKGMRHAPKVLFYQGDDYGVQPFAVVVLSATQSPRFHFSEMAGCNCIKDFPEITDKEVHAALARHEWFHLSIDDHLSLVDIEVLGDEAALTGSYNTELRNAWVDARIMGGFMWPLPGRQNGLPQVDTKFKSSAFQEIQMDTVYEWCARVVEEFYEPERLTTIIRSVLADGYMHESFLPEDMQNFIEGRILTKHLDDIPKIPSYTEFREWFCEGADQELADAAWKFMTQSYVMSLQVSNADQEELYARFYSISEQMSSKYKAESKALKSKVHDRFRESMSRLVPAVLDKEKQRSEFTPAIKTVQLPGFSYYMRPL